MQLVVLLPISLILASAPNTTEDETPVSLINLDALQSTNTILIPQSDQLKGIKELVSDVTAKAPLKDINELKLSEIKELSEESEVKEDTPVGTFHVLPDSHELASSGPMSSGFPEAWKMRAKSVVRSRPFQVVTSVLVIAGVAYACTQAFPETTATCVQYTSDIATQAQNYASSTVSHVQNYASSTVSHAQNYASSVVGQVHTLATDSATKVATQANDVASGLGWLCQEGKGYALHLGGKIYSLGESLKSPLFNFYGTSTTPFIPAHLDNSTAEMCIPVFANLRPQ